MISVQSVHAHSAFIMEGVYRHCIHDGDMTECRVLCRVYIMVPGRTAEYNAEYTSWWHDGVQSIMQSIHHSGMTECRVYIMVP